MKNYNDFLNESKSSDMDISKLSDGMLKEIRKVFNEAKSGLSNADLQMLAKITMEIKKRGIKESLDESIINEGNTDRVKVMKDAIKLYDDLRNIINSKVSDFVPADELKDIFDALDTIKEELSDIRKSI